MRWAFYARHTKILINAIRVTNFMDVVTIYFMEWRLWWQAATHMALGRNHREPLIGDWISTTS